MGIKKGYKQTDLGVIPEDWEEKKLGDECKLITKGTTPTSLGKNFTNDGVNFVKVETLDADGRIIGDMVAFIDEETHKLLKRSQLKEGDLLISIAGALGRIGIVEKNILPANTNQALAIARLKSGARLNLLFVYHYLKTEIIKKHIEGISVQGAQANLSLQNIADLPIYAPDLSEQTAIAEALSDADSYIESLEQLIVKKRQIKQGVLHELLRPKEGWIEKRLGSTASLKARIGWQGLTTSEYMDDGDYFLVTGTEFKDGYVEWSNCHFVTEARYKQDKNIQLREQDVLVTKDGTIGKVAFVNYLEKPATLNSGVFVIRPINDAFHSEFFYYLLTSDIFIKFLNQLSAGSTINHLYQKDFVNFVYRTPKKIDEQETIATILRDIDEEISLLEVKLNKARQIKQGMMQALLTGRMRLI